MQINKLKIFSPKIKEQADFYGQVLGLTILEQTDQKGIIEFGQSVLEIDYKAETTPYHFAINIPANKEEEALLWLKDRVEILKDGEHEIQDFDFWNAMAVYFYDEDLNIVELIARKNLNNPNKEPFSEKQFLEISEIGLPTYDIEEIYSQLNQLTQIEVFDGGFERFCAIGDEHGLFICINKQVKDWFPTSDKAYSSAFEINLTEQGKEYELCFDGEKVSSKD